MKHIHHTKKISPLSCAKPALYLALLGIFSAAHAAGIPTLQEVVINSSTQNMAGTADTASEGTVTAKQLAARPLLRPAEVMEAVPGMVVTQHSGDGKANQYFLRGFNLDHGSDFATSVNGAPVNNVSHGHGQGYMDLNFLIPELVGQMRYRKGVYAAEDGDFAVTGSAHISYLRKLPESFVDVTLGERGYRRGLGVAGKEIGDYSLIGAVEATNNNGPWDQPEHLHKQNGVLRLLSGTVSNGYALTAMAYDADWTATEHVPERAILNGEIGRFGSLGLTDGGKTHRYSLTGEWADTGELGATRSNVYLTDYGLNLFSSPSGLLDGQHEQVDQRTVWGGQLSHAWFLGEKWFDTEAMLGAQYRHDDIQQLGLYNTVNRQRTGIVRTDTATENALGLYAEARTQWLAWLRSTTALRWDRLSADVTPTGGVFNSGNGGSARANQLSPKLGVVLGPFTHAPHTEYFANWGRGFHSNDARGATSRVNVNDGSVIDPVPLIVEATGSEIGVRTMPLPGWSSSLTLWQLNLSSELIFIGDEGVTEPKGASRRHGLEWSNYYTDSNGFIIDGDIAWSQAQLREPSNGGTRVPNAIPLTASLALTQDDGGAWFGGLRLRYIGAYPLEETGNEKSSPFWTANLKLGYRVDKSLQISLDILNLLDRKANDIEYWGAACTTAEGAGCNGGSGIDGRMIHPLEPRTFRIGMRYKF